MIYDDVWLCTVFYKLHADLHDHSIIHNNSYMIYDDWLNVLQRNSHISTDRSPGAQVVIPLTCPFSKDARSLSLGMTTIAIPPLLLLGAALTTCTSQYQHWRSSSTKLKKSAKKIMKNQNISNLVVFASSAACHVDVFRVRSVLLLCHSHVSRGVWALNLFVKYCFLWKGCTITVMQLQKNTGIQGSVLLTTGTLWGAYGICSFLSRSSDHFSSTYLH